MSKRRLPSSETAQALPTIEKRRREASTSLFTAADNAPLLGKDPDSGSSDQMHFLLANRTHPHGEIQIHIAADSAGPFERISYLPVGVTLYATELGTVV